MVINELLANSEDNAPDWIELHNTTDRSINIGGWFLSDDAGDLTKYEMADETSIPAGGYLVFYEDLHFGDEDDPGNSGEDEFPPESGEESRQGVLNE